MDDGNLKYLSEKLGTLDFSLIRQQCREILSALDTHNISLTEKRVLIELETF